MKNYIVCDIDGTCSDATHRLHYIQNKPKDWDAFHAKVGEDSHHEDIRKLLLATYMHVSSLIYVTGRMERCRADTADWLRTYQFPCGGLYMRPDGDFRQDYVVKAEIADTIGLNAGNVWFVLDDRQQVVDMWRSRSIRVLQVAKGDF